MLGIGIIDFKCGVDQKGIVSLSANEQKFTSIRVMKYVIKIVNHILMNVHRTPPSSRFDQSNGSHVGIFSMKFFCANQATHQFDQSKRASSSTYSKDTGGEQEELVNKCIKNNYNILLNSIHFHYLSKRWYKHFGSLQSINQSTTIKSTGVGHGLWAWYWTKWITLTHLVSHRCSSTKFWFQSRFLRVTKTTTIIIEKPKQILPAMRFLRWFVGVARTVIILVATRTIIILVLERNGCTYV